MSTNWDGVQYNIQTQFHDGGILQFPSAGPGLVASLGVDVDDVSQQWILHPGGEMWAYTIENWEFGTFVVAGPDQRLQSSTEPQTWYLVPPPDGSDGRVCADPNCIRVWAPASQVDASQPESNDILLVLGSGSDYEAWDFAAIGSSTVRPTSATPSLPLSSSSSDPPPTVTTTTTTATTTSISTSTTTWTSSSGIGTFTQGSSTATRPYPPESTRPVNTTPGSLQALKSCVPCGSAQCTFTPSGDPSTYMYSVLVGQPVSNCNSGSQESTTTTFSGTYELERSFSIDVTSQAGLGFLGPSIGSSTTVGVANQTRTERKQETTVTIRPGQIGALVANITYVKTPGTIAVDKSTYAFVSVDPENVLGYSVVYTDCASAFQALTLPKKEECTRNSAGRSSEMNLRRQAILYSLILLFGSVAAFF